MARKVIAMGRFEPYHIGHNNAGRLAYDSGVDQLIRIIGSVHKPRTIENPWVFEERELMIRAALTAEENKKTYIYGVEDTLYNNNSWLKKIQTIIKQHTDPGDEIAIVGGQKGEWYMKFFPEPQYKRLLLPEIENINATDIRRAYFTLPWEMKQGQQWTDNGGLTSYDIIKELVPKSTLNYLDMFRKMPAYSYLCKEYEYYLKYWNDLSTYHWGMNAINMVTVDAVVVQSGHVLMVQRKEYPGKGLYALPGGFLNTNEEIEEGMIRELREETHLKIPEKVLRGNIVNTHVFAAPKRSLRGRIITHAHYIELPAENTLPKVRGGDDAAKARWIPLSEIAGLRANMYEDHLDIIEYFLGELSERPIIHGDNP